MAATVTSLGAKNQSFYEANLLARDNSTNGSLPVSKVPVCLFLPPRHTWHNSTSIFWTLVHTLHHLAGPPCPPTLRRPGPWIFPIRAARGNTARPAGTHLTKHGSLITAIFTRLAQHHLSGTLPRYLPKPPITSTASVGSGPSPGTGSLYLYRAWYCALVLDTPVPRFQRQGWCLTR